MTEEVTWKFKLWIGCLVALWCVLFVGSLVFGYYLDLNDHGNWAGVCYLFAALLFVFTWAG